MAKGNDGNYLQHSVEIASAVRLTETDPEGRLHIALTHGMSPWEPFEKSRSRSAYRHLEGALHAATLRPKSDEAAIVTAYRKTNASKKHYPNSAELLRSTIGTEKLSGGITEVDCAKYKQLADAWSGSLVVPVHSSWRHQVEQGGELECPDNLQIPWLFTMDPMTYSEKGGTDDDKLYRVDIDLLAGALTRYVQSGKPGIVALFVYAVMAPNQGLFWEFVDELAERVGATTHSYWLPHLGGNHNLAGLLYSGIELLSDFKPSGLNEGRENITD